MLKSEKYIKKYFGPFGVVRVCTICGFKDMVKTGIPGVGRGYGMREGNKSRGRLIQHINKEHPDGKS